MILCDINVLLNAHFSAQQHHDTAREFLERAANDATPHALSELVLSAFIRIATNRRAFDPPAPLDVAVAFCQDFLERPNARVVAPSARHWSLFVELCQVANARGPLVADAYLAALAIESGCEWISFDRDFARFPGLRWRHPLD